MYSIFFKIRKTRVNRDRNLIDVKKDAQEAKKKTKILQVVKFQKHCESELGLNYTVINSHRIVIIISWQSENCCLFLDPCQRKIKETMHQSLLRAESLCSWRNVH